MTIPRRSFIRVVLASFYRRKQEYLLSAHWSLTNGRIIEEVSFIAIAFQLDVFI